MPLEIVEEFYTFNWSISKIQLLNLKYGNNRQSIIFELGKLVKSSWSLKIVRRNKIGKHVCYLKRHEKNNSNTPLTSVLFKLEVVEINGEILNSVVQKKSSFPIEHSETILNLFSPECLQRLYGTSNYENFTLRCHIIYEDSIKQRILWNIPTIIQTQWQIKIQDLANWPNVIKAPLHENTHIDITLSESKDAIVIRVDKVDLPQAYEIKILAFDSKKTEISFKDSVNILQSSDEKMFIDIQLLKNQVRGASSMEYSFTLMCVVSLTNGSSPLEVQSHSTGNSTYQHLPSETASRLSLQDPSETASRFPLQDPSETASRLSLQDPTETASRLPLQDPSETASWLPLQEDLKELLLNEKHSDVKLRVGDKIIPTHKCLLSARSPVFSTMFDQDMLENRTGLVDIPDIEIETLRSFLEFLYTDTIACIDYRDILKLLMVADKYQVLVLKDRCSKLLMPKLTVENVCEVISVADMVNHSNLKLCAYNFLKDNKKKVISSSIWTEWVANNTKLSVEMLSKLIID